MHGLGWGSLQPHSQRINSQCSWSHDNIYEALAICILLITQKLFADHAEISRLDVYQTHKYGKFTMPKRTKNAGFALSSPQAGFFLAIFLYLC